MKPSTAAGSLKPFVFLDLKRISSRSGKSARDATAALRETVEGIWKAGCESWAIRRLPFAIVAGACADWVLGLATGPSLRASTAVAATLEILRPRQRGSRVPRKHEPAVNILEG
jgi:hypothetical protein